MMKIINMPNRIHERYPDVPFFLQVGNDDIKTMDNAQLISKFFKNMNG